MAHGNAQAGGIAGSTGPTGATGATGAQGPAGPDAGPWGIDIALWYAKVSSVGSWAFLSDANQIFSRYLYANNPAINDEIDFDVLIPAGTWTISVLGVQGSNCGIITVKLDGTIVGTIDQYSNATQYNIMQSISGVVVATATKYRMKFITLGKNASSSNYYVYFSAINLTRTV